MAEQRRSNLSVCGLLPNSRGGAWLGPGGGGAVGFDSDFPGPLPGGPCPAPGLVLLVRDSESGSVRAQHGRRGGPSQLGSEAQRFGMAPGAGTAQQPKCQAASSELPGPHQLGTARPAPTRSCPTRPGIFMSPCGGAADEAHAAGQPHAGGGCACEQCVRLCCCGGVATSGGVPAARRDSHRGVCGTVRQHPHERRWVCHTSGTC